MNIKQIAFGLSMVLMLGITLPAMAQDFTTQDPRYTTTPPEYTTTPSEYQPQPDTSVPGMNDGDNTNNGMNGADSTNGYGMNGNGNGTDSSGTNGSGMFSSENADGFVGAYAQYVLRLDETESREFVNDFDNLAGQLGFQSNEVSLEVGVEIVLYLTVSQLLGLPEMGIS